MKRRRTQAGASATATRTNPVPHRALARTRRSTRASTPRRTPRPSSRATRASKSKSKTTRKTKTPGDLGDDAPRGFPYPALQNGSFAITDGLPGPLISEALEPLPLGAGQAAPWVACRLGLNVVESADADRGSLAGDVLPPDPPTFVESELGPASAVMGLRQTLSAPLAGGQRYAFRVDVRASLGADAAFEVWGALGCIQVVQLARVEAISDQVWQSRCVVFTAPFELPDLVLAPVGAEGTRPGARLFFDDVRPDPSCK